MSVLRERNEAAPSEQASGAEHAPRACSHARDLQLGGAAATSRYARDLQLGSGGYEVQRAALIPSRDLAESAQAAAAAGTAGGGGPLPHLAAIQHSFGRHDVGGIQAHVGGKAASACAQMGAQGYASGSTVAFEQAPGLHLAAHEAAHVVQQRGGVSLSGGVGKAGDKYEQHADAVADLVVQGKSAESLLDSYAGGGSSAGDAGVQHKLHQTATPALQGPVTETRKGDAKVPERMSAPYTVDATLDIDFGDTWEQTGGDVVSQHESLIERHGFKGPLVDYSVTKGSDVTSWSVVPVAGLKDQILATSPGPGSPIRVSLSRAHSHTNRGDAWQSGQAGRYPTNSGGHLIDQVSWTVRAMAAAQPETADDVGYVLGRMRAAGHLGFNCHILDPGEREAFDQDVNTPAGSNDHAWYRFARRGLWQGKGPATWLAEAATSRSADLAMAVDALSFFTGRGVQAANNDLLALVAAARTLISPVAWDPTCKLDDSGDDYQCTDGDGGTKALPPAAAAFMVEVLTTHALWDAADVKDSDNPETKGGDGELAPSDDAHYELARLAGFAAGQGAMSSSAAGLTGPIALIEGMGRGKKHVEMARIALKRVNKDSAAIAEVLTASASHQRSAAAAGTRDERQNAGALRAAQTVGYLEGLTATLRSAAVGEEQVAAALAAAQFGPRQLAACTSGLAKHARSTVDQAMATLRSTAISRQKALNARLKDRAGKQHTAGRKPGRYVKSKRALALRQVADSLQQDANSEAIAGLVQEGSKRSQDAAADAIVVGIKTLVASRMRTDALAVETAFQMGFDAVKSALNSKVAKMLEAKQEGIDLISAGLDISKAVRMATIATALTGPGGLIVKTGVDIILGLVKLWVKFNLRALKADVTGKVSATCASHRADGLEGLSSGLSAKRAELQAALDRDQLPDPSASAAGGAPAMIDLQVERAKGVRSLDALHKKLSTSPSAPLEQLRLGVMGANADWAEQMSERAQEIIDNG